jgi:RimJ/RimL family protein N-acetyltransferase
MGLSEKRRPPSKHRRTIDLLVSFNPRNYLAEETLKDGTAVTIRAIRADDGKSILEVFKNLDQESVYRRFFNPKKELTDGELKQLADVDFSQVVALVVTTQTEDGEELIGGGRYASEAEDRPQSAELAFLTQDGYQGRGIASLVLKHLVRIARETGMARLEADVLAGNQPMIAVFRRSGLPMRQSREGNVIHVTLSLQAEPKKQL